MQKQTLMVERKSLSEFEIADEAIDATELENGQVLLQVDRFSFTANNITYALMGEALGYWNFFPGIAGKGVIPVWGFADVIASQCEDVSVGERYYGYYPFSTHLVVKPTRLSSAGFFDGEAHRVVMPAIYNQYIRCSSDPLYRADTEAIQMLLRPLFTTSFLLEDFFRDNQYFDADNILLTSASSKTAIGMAFMLRQKRTDNQPRLIIGLTSRRNLEFTQGLGCYDLVFAYDQVNDIEAQNNSAIVDFAGDVELTNLLHHHFALNLKYSCMVGASHGAEMSMSPVKRPGPSPVLFFAPSQAGKRWSEWGKELFEQRLAESWDLFSCFVSGWLVIETAFGVGPAVKSYQQVLSGQVSPDRGLILSLFDG